MNVIIIIEKGIICSVSSSNDFKYVVVDMDNQSEDEMIINPARHPDVIDPKLSLDNIEII